MDGADVAGDECKRSAAICVSFCVVSREQNLATFDQIERRQIWKLGEKLDEVEVAGRVQQHQFCQIASGETQVVQKVRSAAFCVCFYGVQDFQLKLCRDLAELSHNLRRILTKEASFEGHLAIAQLAKR